MIFRMEAACALSGQFPVLVHRVTGQVQPGRLLFHREQLALGQLGNVRQGDLGVLHRFIPHAEQVDLSLDVLPAALCDRVHDRARRS